MTEDPRSVALAVALYHAGIALYPRPFRSRFGSEMRRVFRDRARAVHRERGVLSLLSLLARDLTDLAATAAIERILGGTTMTKRDAIRLLALSAATLACGIASGWLDLHEVDVQAPVLVILASTVLLASLDPRRGWLWAALVGLSIPVAHVLAGPLGIHPPYTPNSFASTFLALVPALIGAGIVAGVRRMVIRSPAR